MLGNLKNIFFEPVEKKIADSPLSDSDSDSDSVTVNIDTNTVNSSIVAASNVNGIAEDIFVQHFEKLIVDVNILKPDYIDFRKAIHNMNNMTLDEATKYKVVFATLTTQGLSKDKLIESLNCYIDRINNDKNRFDASVSDKITNDISTRNVQIKENEDLIKQYAAQIDELSKKIADSNVLINQYKIEQQEITDKLDTKIANYNTTQKKYLSDLTNDIKNINSYL